eukprot:COSAG06_NODE_2443_length_6870_cov_2.396544_2_plen_56_part_00
MAISYSDDGSVRYERGVDYDVQDAPVKNVPTPSNISHQTRGKLFSSERYFWWFET